MRMYSLNNLYTSHLIKSEHLETDLSVMSCLLCAGNTGYIPLESNKYMSLQQCI